MERRGRKPLAVGHVERLEGSGLAKLRLTTILETMRSELTIPAACERLGVCESRFHALRQQWLQKSLGLLEPQPVGRPPKTDDRSSREAELASTVARLEQELQLTQARQEVAEILSVPETETSSKKKMRAERARRLRALRRRPR